MSLINLPPFPHKLARLFPLEAICSCAIRGTSFSSSLSSPPPSPRLLLFFPSRRPSHRLVFGSVENAGCWRSRSKRGALLVPTHQPSPPMTSIKCLCSTRLCERRSGSDRQSCRPVLFFKPLGAIVRFWWWWCCWSWQRHPI